MRENKTAWEKVLLARKSERPKALDYINKIFDDFIELHGDYYFGDDKAIVGGIATIEGIAVTVIGEQKGKTTKENMQRNFGMPSPEGYRKALRLMKQAEKFKRPIITFVDTPGAYAGMGAEQRGQRRGNCKKYYGNVKIKYNCNMYCNWRRIKWRSFGISCRRQNFNARKCSIFYFITRRVCKYFI